MADGGFWVIQMVGSGLFTVGVKYTDQQGHKARMIHMIINRVGAISKNSFNLI